MYNLLTLLNAADKAAITESNMTALDASLAFQRAPSQVAGVPTAVSGPPTAGTFPQSELWCDALGAVWLCTAAGTPGTWCQVEPGIAAAFPATAPAAGYALLRSDEGQLYYYTGAAWIAGVQLYDATTGLRHVISILNTAGVLSIQFSAGY